MILGKYAIVIDVEDAKKILNAIQHGHSAAKNYYTHLHKLGLLQTVDKLKSAIRSIEDEGDD